MTGQEAKEILEKAGEIKAPYNERGITKLKFNKIIALTSVPGTNGFYGMGRRKTCYNIDGEIEVYKDNVKEVMERVSISEDNFRLILKNVQEKI